MPDREKIINAIEKAKKQSEEYAQDRIIVPFKETDMILALLKEQPEIVRCKDCVYHENEKARSNQTAWLPCMEIQTKKNWYCADGVRKK